MKQEMFSFLLKYVKFQHRNKVKYNTCIQYALTEITQGLNNLNNYHF